MKSIGIFLTAAWFVLAGLSVAHAEPITIALFGAAFAATTAGAVVSYLIGAVIAYGVSLLSQALLGEQEQAQTQGVKLTVQMGDDKPMSFIAGTTATAGKRKYIGAWGKDGKTPNAYLTDVIEVANLPVPGLPGFWVDNQKVTVLWGEAPTEQGWPVAEYRVNGKDYLWFKYYDGTQTVADPFLLNKFGADPDRPYEPGMIGRGCPYFIATARLNSELFPNQPTYLAETPVPAWYDVRKDSTAGGSGTQRWDNPATWAPSDNPVVIIYNIIRGIYYNGEWVYGGQNLPAFRLPASNWMVAANECDRLIPLAGGGSEKQFRCGTEISCDMEPLAVIEKLKKACNGRIAENGGVFKILVGAPGAAVYSFSDNDILVTKGQSFTPFPGLSETYNGIEATYPEPLEKWATKDAPARYSNALEAADGNRRLASGVTFEAVPFPVQVQRLMKLLLEEDRRFRIHSFYLPPDAFLLEPNDVVSWTSVRNGYVNKKFLIVRIIGERSMNQLVVLKEIDPSDYDWSTDEQVPVSVGPVGPIVNPSHPMFGWQALPATLDDDSGPRRPTIEVFYAGDQDGVDRIRVQVYLKDTSALWFDGELPYEAPLDQQYSTKLVAVFAPNTEYQVRGIYVSNIGKNFTWSGLIDVTTPDVRLGADDIYPGGLVDSVLASLGNHLEWLAEGVHYARDELDRLNLIAADSGAQSTRDKKELLAEVGSANAKYSNEILVIAKANEAAVIRIEEINAAITDPETGLTANANAIDSLSVVVTDIDGELTAVANSVTSLTTTVGRFSATGLFRTTVEATAAGALATIGLSVSATGGGATSQAAMILSALAGGLSEIGFLADRIYMVNGANKRRPFIFSGGVLYLDDVRVTSLSALSATLGNVDISNAIIGNLIVGTSNLGFNSVTDKQSYSGGSTGTQGTWTVVAAVATQNPNPNPVFCEFGFSAVSHANGGGFANARVRWRRDGVVLKQYLALATGVGGVPADRSAGEIWLLSGRYTRARNQHILHRGLERARLWLC
ncbi:phage tail protein [Phyllobacterium sp. A18/5-2]|uniref:phage tail protein n=1 Tax=Phyllobacterium sp. A18/5-2 TaxID=2978392 RepID=UPI0021C63B46|nr:phage tail protein [Phyllobacterium sp. A18/5-2]UXN64402.1 phage tail protein [Phyllobacterium sp. A18/5-2]